MINARDDFDFDIINCPFCYGDVPRSIFYRLYIHVSQLIWSARVSDLVADFNIRNKILTAKLLKQSYRYHKLRFIKKLSTHYGLVSIFNVRLKSLLKQDLSELKFDSDLVYTTYIN